VIHPPESAKHPPESRNPTFDVVVAWPTMLSPRSVVVPNPPPAISRAEIEVVANVVAEEVEMKSEPPALLKTKGLFVPSLSANCGALDDDIWKVKCGVVVPTPIQLFRKMEESVLDVEMSEPIVKLLDVVAIKFVPFESEVMSDQAG